MPRARAPSGPVVALSVTRPTTSAHAASRATVLCCIRPATSAGADVVKVLLGNSDVDARNARLFTPLHLCAGALASLSKLKDAEAAASCASLLLDKGADPSLLGRRRPRSTPPRVSPDGHFENSERVDRGRRGPDATNDGRLARRRRGTRSARSRMRCGGSLPKAVALKLPGPFSARR